MTREILLSAAVALNVATGAAGCKKDKVPDRGPSAAKPSSEKTRPNPPDPNGAKVVFETSAGQITVSTEVVRREREIRRGLMYRTHLAENAGMLFLFRHEKIQSFWMKNTLISLDMIFIRADMTVAGVKANTPPRTLASQRVETPSQYVLEVNAGWAAKNGVSAGTTARFENIQNVPPGVEMSKAPTETNAPSP